MINLDYLEKIAFTIQKGGKGMRVTTKGKKDAKELEDLVKGKRKSTKPSGYGPIGYEELQAMPIPAEIVLPGVSKLDFRYTGNRPTDTAYPSAAPFFTNIENKGRVINSNPERRVFNLGNHKFSVEPKSPLGRAAQMIGVRL